MKDNGRICFLIILEWCMKGHRSKVCRRRFTCKICGRTMTQSGTPGFRTMEELKKTHKCDSKVRFCSQCSSHHVPEEKCRMKYAPLKKNTTKLCFISFAVSSSDFTGCLRCFNGNCNLHDFLNGHSFEYINHLQCLKEVKKI